MCALPDSLSPTRLKPTSSFTALARNQCFNASSVQQHAVAKLIYAFTCKSCILPMSQSSANAVVTNTQIVTLTRCTPRPTKARNATAAMFVPMLRFHSVILSPTCLFTRIRSRLFALSVSRLSGRSSFLSAT